MGYWWIYKDRMYNNLKSTMGDLEEKFIADKDAFIFHFKSPQKRDPFISKVKQDEYSIKHALGLCQGYYACFGKVWVFCVMAEEWDNEAIMFSVRNNSAYNDYEKYPYNWEFLTGEQNCGQGYEDITDFVIEAFQINM